MNTANLLARLESERAGFPPVSEKEWRSICANAELLSQKPERESSIVLALADACWAGYRSPEKSSSITYSKPKRLRKKS